MNMNYGKAMPSFILALSFASDEYAGKPLVQTTRHGEYCSIHHFTVQPVDSGFFWGGGRRVEMKVSMLRTRR
jgi:hypothetical protein